MRQQKLRGSRTRNAVSRRENRCCAAGGSRQPSRPALSCAALLRPDSVSELQGAAQAPPALPSILLRIIVRRSMAEVVYRALGSDGGTARSTQSGYVYAIRHFNIFLAKMGIDRKFTELLEDEICSVKLFQQFGTYLAEDARDRNDDFLMVGSAIQYLSGKPYSR